MLLFCKSLARFASLCEQDGVGCLASPLLSSSGLILQVQGGLQGCLVLGGLSSLSCLSKALCIYK